MTKQGSPWLVPSLAVGRREASWAFVTQCFSARTPPHPALGPDLDECRVRNLCQHACQNTEGSYQCLCPAGYRLLPSGKNCQGEQQGASLTQSALSPAPPNHLL